MEVTEFSLKRVLKTLDAVGNKYPKAVVNLLQAEGLIIETNAKKNLVRELAKRNPSKSSKSTYHGLLSASIHSKNNPNGVQVSASKNYAAYVEFGTGDLVDIPQGWETFAAKFKGRGIRKVNSRARPYLVKAFIDESPKIVHKLRELYKRMIK